MAQLRWAIRAVAIAVGLFALWQAIWAVWDPPTYILPSATSVLSTLVSDRGILLTQAWYTAYATLIGFLIAVVAGTTLAAVLHLLPRLASVLWPSILFIQLTPKVALAPLLLIWLGFGITSKVMIAFLIAFFAILANALEGLESTTSEVVELAHSMRAGRIRAFLRFEAPHALPAILSGARIAVTFALVGTVVGEFVGSDNGLGNLVLQSDMQLQTQLMFAAIVALAVLGLLLYAAVGLLERALIPWHQSQRGQDGLLARSRTIARGL